jgi:HK97 gp10 family phage protein
MAVAGPLIKLALGKGKAAKAEYGLQALDDVVQALKALPKDISLKYQLRALRKAAKPGQEALRSQVSQIGQVTGNLLASVSKVERKYTNNKQGLPIGVIVVGFRRPTNSQSQKMATPAFAGGSVLKGPNRAYHSHLVEKGTRPRTAGKSKRTGRKRVVLGGRLRTLIQREKAAVGGRAILSSFRSRGPFEAGGGRYPKDFIATGTVRGAPAQQPLQKAFNQSKGQMQSILDTEMRKALTKAIREYQKRMGGAG